MNIDIVTDTYEPDVNGVAMTLGRLTRGLRGRGHQVHIVHTAEPSGSEDETALRGVSLPGYQEVRVGLPKPMKLRRMWEERRPDVVYVATESPMGASAVRACRKLAIPCVMGFHTNFDQYLDRYFLGSVRPFAVSYLRKIHEKAMLTLVPSKDVENRLLDHGFQHLAVMGRGVDTELFDPARRSEELRKSWGVEGNGPVAMIVGRVAAEKNLDLAMRSFEAMRERCPELVAVVVGDGPLRSGLERTHRWVKFAGMQKGEDLGRHYASADILLFPSETETFGNVTLEGMASGLVTVSYDYAASMEHVIDGENGLKAALGDEEGFVDQAVEAIRFVDDQEFRARARGVALSKSWEQIVGEFEGHLEGVIPKAVWREDVKLSRDVKGHFRFRTVFLSDVHLGTADSKATELCDFLKAVRCEQLILNGDIVDGWALKRGGKWQPEHMRFVRMVLKKVEKEGTKVIYLRGNHDDFLEKFLPMELGGVEVLKEYVYETLDGKKYLVIHGDGFDQVSTNHQWLAHVGAVGYDALLKFNRFYNWYRSKRGKEYFSLSKLVKEKVKASVSFVGKYEEQLQDLARKRECDGIICGHIHTPADRQVGEVHYLNSGDWVESLTGIVEYEEGGLSLFSYDDFLQWKHQRAEEKGKLKKEKSSESSLVRAVE